MRYVATAFLFACLLPCAAGADEDKLTLARQAQTVLKTACYRCHGKDGASEGGFNYVLDRDRLVAGRKIVPGDLAHSRPFQKLREYDMPPDAHKPLPT